MAIASIIADRLMRDPADLEHFDNVIAAAGLRPSQPSEHAALLLLTTLAGATPDTVLPTARAIVGLSNSEGDAVGFVGAMIDALGKAKGAENPLAVLAYRSAISVVLGDGIAVVVRADCEDGPEEWAFTDDGGRFAPHRDMSVSIALACPGRVLFRIAADVHDLEPIERRTYPFRLHTVNGVPVDEWKAGVEGELARMPVNQ